MVSPSLVHEQNVDLLDSLAILSGHSMFLDFGHDSIPDVVRLDIRNGRVFVGDGKATETPGCSATELRLGRYASAVARWAKLGFTVRLAICHNRHWDSGGWLAVLGRSAKRAGLVEVGRGAATIEVRSTVTWMDLIAAREGGP